MTSSRPTNQNSRLQTRLFGQFFLVQVGVQYYSERIYDVATDKNGDTYVLVKVRYLCTYRALVFDASAVLCREIELTKERDIGHIVSQSLSLTVNANNKVLVLKPVLSEGFWHGLVHVHETNGQFICIFGKGLLKREMNVGATDILLQQLMTAS